MKQTEAESYCLDFKDDYASSQEFDCSLDEVSQKVGDTSIVEQEHKPSPFLRSPITDILSSEPSTLLTKENVTSSNIHPNSDEHENDEVVSIEPKHATSIAYPETKREDLISMTPPTSQGCKVVEEEHTMKISRPFYAKKREAGRRGILAEGSIKDSAVGAEERPLSRKRKKDDVKSSGELRGEKETVSSTSSSQESDRGEGITFSGAPLKGEAHEQAVNNLILEHYKELLVKTEIDSTPQPVQIVLPGVKQKGLKETQVAPSKSLAIKGSGLGAKILHQRSQMKECLQNRKEASCQVTMPEKSQEPYSKIFQTISSMKLTATGNDATRLNKSGPSEERLQIPDEDVGPENSEEWEIAQEIQQSPQKRLSGGDSDELETDDLIDQVESLATILHHPEIAEQKQTIAVKESQASIFKRLTAIGGKLKASTSNQSSPLKARQSGQTSVISRSISATRQCEKGVGQDRTFGIIQPFVYFSTLKRVIMSKQSLWALCRA